MRLSEIIRYYSTPGVAQEITRYAEGREVAVQFQDKFGKRPDIIQFPSDVLNQVRKGATSFHASEERWSNPLKLSSETTKREMDDLRASWDLVIDIDCKLVDWSKICADLLVEALKWHDINCISLKFSGGSGWHLGIPAEALSDEKLAFPETPQTIVLYLKEFIKQHLLDRIYEYEGDLRKIVEKSGKKKEEISQILKMGSVEGSVLDPFSVLGIDIVAISSRHMIRMPYSLNEKKWLVSIPIKPKDLKQFDVSWAKPENIKEISDDFLNPAKVKPGEASQLLMQALDWKASLEAKETRKEVGNKFEFTEKVPREAFPPCMKLILEGLPDGRKRALFALINFMKSAGWPLQEVEQELQTWNMKNQPPLKQGYIKSQLSWHKRQTTTFPPPNCKKYFEEFGVCKPDFTCGRIKNPISYPRLKLKKPQA
jgi:hypothetical protein